MYVVAQTNHHGYLFKNGENLRGKNPTGWF